MERLSYLDFELKIEREEEHYTARVLRSPAGEASSIFTLPFSEEKLELLVLKLGRVGRSSRRVHSAEMAAACDLGGKLFQAVFSGEVLACFRSSLDKVTHQDGTGLRLKLWLQEVAELADLPWEFLFDPSLDRFLAQSNQTPIVRYVEMPQRVQPLIVNLPLHVLVMISSPRDHVRLDVEREKDILQKALGPLCEQGKIQVEWLQKASLATLQRCLRAGLYHVFHFIGHGGFDNKTEEGMLVLENERGLGWVTGAHRIGTVLHDHRSMRLAVLNSCEGARNSRTDPFAGVAATLIRQGIAAVVAMQFEIADETAIVFASEFYTALADGFPVDAAVAEARKAIYVQGNDVEWGTPVLYLRASDGHLFTVEQKSWSDDRQKSDAAHNTRQQITSLYEEARTLLGNENWDAAIEKLQTVMKLDPVHKDVAAQLRTAQQQQELSALYESGRKYYKEERWHEALNEFDRILQKESNYKDVKTLLQNVQRTLAKRPEGVTEVTESVRPVDSPSPLPLRSLYNRTNMLRGIGFAAVVLVVIVGILNIERQGTTPPIENPVAAPEPPEELASKLSLDPVAAPEPLDDLPSRPSSEATGQDLEKLQSDPNYWVMPGGNYWQWRYSDLEEISYRNGNFSIRRGGEVDRRCVSVAQ